MKLALKLRKIVNKKMKEKQNEKETINYIIRLIEIQAKRGENSYSYDKELETFEIDWKYIKDYFLNEGFTVLLNDETLLLMW